MGGAGGAGGAGDAGREAPDGGACDAGVEGAREAALERLADFRSSAVLVPLDDRGGLWAAEQHAEWGSLLDEGAFPVGARALIRVRRVDGSGRESVGLLLTGYRSQGGTGVVDGSADPIMDLNEVAASGFQLIRYR
ncbi:hypothetical protein [Streptomyces sp. NPDC006368]|uniref:hypothetical protein n=1 Tax=Streptomyces sp. NPDC006368 TaxID=3156760 RepID=UPI0033A16BC0